MGFSITGYVLEPPRVGQSNSPFTATPNNIISNQAAYNTAYPTDESNPRDDYLVLVTSEVAPSPPLSPPFPVGGLPAAGPAGLLVNAGFGWTKNEIINRLDYDTKGGRFRTLPGGALAVLGVLGPTSNTTRLTAAPIPVELLAAAPFRLSIGTFGSGTTQTVSLVFNDGAFGSPPPGTTELSLATGHLNWNPLDLVTYDGETVQWQQQQYFALSASIGNIGTLSTAVTAPAILLNPIPGTGQFPLIRIGYLKWLTTVQVPNEGSFTTPPSGTVQWALSTGRLNFNPTDVTNNNGTNVYYDGTLFARDLVLPRQNIGIIDSPGALSLPLPATGGDIIFSLPTVSTYYQFPQFSLVPAFSSPGTQGTVQINGSTGAVQFSTADVAKYTGHTVEVIYGDLPIDHGISIRFFRCPVDLNAQTLGAKDITALYSVTNAVWASPIQPSPLVFLPATPLDDNTLVVSVGQGTGSFIGPLNAVNGQSPPAGLGYTINFDTNQLSFAQRKNNVLIPLQVPQGFVQLPDSMVESANIVLSIETGVGTGNFTTLTPGVNCLVDALTGLVYFTTSSGVVLAQGASGTFTGTTLTDPTATFTTDGVLPGDYLEVVSDTNQVADGIYTVVTVLSQTTLTVDVAPPAGSGTLGYEILSGKEILADRFFVSVTLTDPNTSVERITSLGTIQNALTIVATGNATFPDLNTLSDSTSNLSQVQPGDTITLTSGPSATTTFIVLQAAPNGVSGGTLTPATPFTSAVACTYSVTRRLHVPVSYIGSIRFRYGLPPPGQIGVFSTAVNTVANDASFSSPSFLAQGVVEVSQTTGNLNFSSIDVIAGGLIYVSRRLALGTDYQIQAGLGLIQFSQRLLTNEEVLLNYTQAPTPPATVGVPFTERGVFLVRKELTQPHPQPTSTLTFNPTGKAVASVPAPAVFRGGRPQSNLQVSVSPATSTITFLSDTTNLVQTDALPHGSTVNPNENVYIDYYIYQAMGGEQTLTVQNPPILTSQVILNEGTNSFSVAGNQTTVFPAGFLMLVNNAEVYQIGSSVYNPTTQFTTVTLAGTQLFQSDQTNPPLAVVSGPTPLTSAPLQPAYFSQELSPFSPIARGMNTVQIPGDKRSVYPANVVLYFTDYLTSFSDFYLVGGSSYSATANTTTVTILTNSIRQYQFGQQILFRSVREIFGTAPTVLHTNLTPISVPAPQPVTVFRRVAGQVGQVLKTPTGYTADQSGTITVTTPLQPDEEISIFYTGHRTVAANLRVKVSYTCTITPNATNGLLGQVLNANYTIFSPDNFYYRVETLTVFKGEMIQAIQAAAQSGSPSSGPMTSNTSTPQLFDQGRPSVFFNEGDYANQDIVARDCLVFFNSAVNYLEDTLHALDGRVVGDASGPFLFDGSITNPVRATYAAVTNQIDDYLLVSPFPLPSGTTQQVWLQGPFSRFYKNRRNIFLGSPALVQGSPSSGTAVGKFDFQNLSSLPGTCFKRWPRAQIQFDYPAGTTTFLVDNANASNDSLQRPGFITQMRVVVADAEGNVYIADSSFVTVVAVSRPLPATQTLTLSAGSIFPIPAGATIYLSPSDANSSLSQGEYPPGVGNSGAYAMVYKFGHDVNANLTTGELLYETRHFPYNGTISSLPPPFNIISKSEDIYPIQNGDIIEADGAGVSVTYTAPYKFPALFGGTTDDDGNQAVPIVGPTFDGELNPSGGGPLNIEATNEAPGSVFRDGLTAPPFVGTGVVSGGGTTITISPSAVFPAPIPQVWDLVRIVTTGADAIWRPILTVNNVLPASITVAGADAFLSTGTVSFAVAVSSATISGTAVLASRNFKDSTKLFVPYIPTSTVVSVEAAIVADSILIPAIDPSVAILANSTLTATATVPPSVGTQVGVGWTVVMTSGSNIGHHRQIVAIADVTDLTLDSAFPFPTAGGTYRIVNPLNSYNGPTLTALQTAVATELATISTGPNSEQASLLGFFSTIFTTVVGPSSTGAVSGTTLTDLSVDFVASGVTTSHLVYVHVGTSGAQLADMQVYQIGTVVDSHHITVNQPFPAVGTVTYEIVSIFGTTYTTLNTIFTILIQNAIFIPSTQAFQPVLTTLVPVQYLGVVDASAYANGIENTGDDLGNRYLVVSARLLYVTGPTGPIGIITTALNSSDQFYNKRYVWIDARIDLQSGLLVLEQTAVAQRIATQTQVFNQLIKLLTVQGS